MARNKIILSLPREEQEALNICGISQDEQLARISPRALLRDMETAANLFPDTLETLPEYSRLEYICALAASTVKLPTAEAVAGAWRGKKAPIDVANEEPQNLRFSPASGRMLVDDQVIKQAEILDERRRNSDPRDFAHAICCQHPVAVYLGAWFTIFLMGVIFILLLGVVGILIGIDFSGPVKPLIAALVVTVLGYAVLAKSAICSTCRIAIFSFRPFPKHRKAHHIPLLGYTLATALMVIFLFRFRCPSCGTTQKLFGKRHRSSRRGRH